MSEAAAGGRADHHTPGADEILDKLRDHGGRRTTGRRAIVEALIGAGREHLSAEELAAAVQAEHPHVHLSTVYRTLDALESIGVVDRVAFGGASAVYHFVERAHHHLVCTDCGAVTEVPDDLVSSLASELDARYAFTLDHPHLVMTGRCRDCASH